MTQNIHLINADVITGLKSIDNDSIDTIITSPPYWGLRNYQVDGQIGMEPTLEEYLERLLKVTKECKRVLKPTGVMFWNHGDSYPSGGEKAHESSFNRNMGIDTNSQPDHRVSAKLRSQHGKCLIMQNERLIMQMIDNQGWILRNRIIWCLSSSTILYVKSQKGIMPMTIHDMVRLDPNTVQLWNGNKWTQVLGWSDTPILNVSIKLILRNGDRISCTPEHKFPTNKGMVIAKELQIGDVLKTVILPQPDYPDCPVHLPDESIGWFVGMYMAEGSLGDGGKTIQISSHVKETERYNKLKIISDEYGGTCRMYNTKGNSATINMYGDVLIAIIKKYIYGNSARNKHLRVSCWNRNNVFLNAVLRGYLEGDGHYDVKNDRWRLGFTRNYTFESDLRTLSARLGISIRINRSVAKIGDKEYPSFRGEIRFNRSSHGNNRQNTEIVDIKCARSGKFWSIGVIDEPHIFALASGILTSNSKPNGMPSSAQDRFTNKYEPVYMLTKNKKYHFDLDAVKVPAKYQEVWSRKGSEKGTPYETTGNNPRSRWGLTKDEIKAGVKPDGFGMKNPGDVWKIPTQPHKDAHFAIFPDALVEPMIKAGCPLNVCPKCGFIQERITERENINPRKINGVANSNEVYSNDTGIPKTGSRYGDTLYHTVGWTTCNCDAGWEPGTVLDPFAGSGTTMKVAKTLGYSTIGIEISKEYCKIIKKNLLFHQNTLGNIVNEFTVLE